MLPTPSGSWALILQTLAEFRLTGMLGCALTPN